MKSTIFVLVAPLLVATRPALATAPASDPSIILGKYFPSTYGKALYAAWPSESDPCASGVATTIALASPQDMGLCGHPFTAGTNPNFTNVEVEGCQFGPQALSIAPVKKGASPEQLCIQLTANNRTCPGTPAVGIFELDNLCGGPLTTG